MEVEASKTPGSTAGRSGGGKTNLFSGKSPCEGKYSIIGGRRAEGPIDWACPSSSWSFFFFAFGGP